MNLGPLKSTKYQSFIGLVLLSSTLCYFGKVTGADLFSFWEILFGLFVGGNIGQKFVNAKYQKDNSVS